MRLRKTFQEALFKTKTTDKFKIKLFKPGFAHSRIQPLNSTNIHFWHGAEDMREASRTGEDKVLRVGEGSDKVRVLVQLETWVTFCGHLGLILWTSGYHLMVIWVSS